MTKETNHSNETTQDLVNSLCATHNGTVPLCCPYRRAAAMLSLIVLYNVIVLKLDTYRPDLNFAVTNQALIFEIILAGVIAVASAVTTALLMVPNMYERKWMLPVSLMLLFTFGLWIVASFYVQNYEHYTIHFMGECFKDGIIYTSLPTFVVVLLTRNGACTHRYLMTLFSTVTVASVGWISLRFICTVDNASHIFIDHMLPFTVIGVVLGLFSKKLFSW